MIDRDKPFESFFGIDGHVELDRNPRSGYNILLMRLITGELYNVCPLRQFRLSKQKVLHYQNSTCQAGRQFVPFSLWSLV